MKILIEESVLRQALDQLQRTACDYASHGAVVALRSALDAAEKVEWLKERESLRQQLAEVQVKYTEREQECRTAFGKEMELRKQLAECERERDDRASPEMTMILRSTLATVTKERDALSSAYDALSRTHDAQLAKCQRELEIVLQHDVQEYKIWLDNKNVSYPPITFFRWRHEKYQAALAQLGADKEEKA